MARSRTSGYRVETRSWQGLVQWAASMIGRGYYHGQVVQYPAEKQERWPEIDRKLAGKFGVIASKYVRARRKKAGLANYMIARWETQLLVLRSQGDTSPDAEDGERFVDLKRGEVRLRIGDYLSLILRHRDGKAEVAMDRETFRGKKAVLTDLASRRAVNAIRREMDMLGGIPGYASANEQKKRLAAHARRELLRHQVRLPLHTFRVRLGRRIVQVW